MNWHQAFARQAASDLHAREVLAADSKLPACHGLHFLQMACEKLCKASMMKAGADPLELQRSHASIAKHLPKIVQHYVSLRNAQLPRKNWITKALRPLARKIELLNPAMRDGGSAPENCEYPWAGPNGTILVPADHSFEFSILHERAGVMLLKIIQQAAMDLQKETDLPPSPATTPATP